VYMGETDPFVCQQYRCVCATEVPVRRHVSRCRATRPGRPGAPWGMHPSYVGDRVGVARSYLTPDAQWHTIWRTLANPGE